jgi:hypothetical protein
MSINFEESLVSRTAPETARLAENMPRAIRLSIMAALHASESRQHERRYRAPISRRLSPRPRFSLPIYLYSPGGHP